MTAPANLVPIACPYCESSRSTPWGEERGFHVVRCADCAFLFMNPSLDRADISKAVETGFHAEAEGMDVRAHRHEGKVRQYRALFADLCSDMWRDGAPVHWLDVGAGYGEIVEAVFQLAPAESVVEGLEPMGPKAADARSRGLRITQDYLRPGHPPVDVISSIDVFSHVPDYRAFLRDVAGALKPGGRVIIETGNLADVSTRGEFPFELGLPDHLTFAGKAHLVGLLQETGFEVERIVEKRVDTALALVKSVAKKLIGRPGKLRVPYTSDYRQLVVRARLAG